MKYILSLFVCISIISVVNAQDVKLPEKPKNRTHFRDYSIQSSGYWSTIEAFGGATVMLKRHNIASIGATWVNGYRFNEYLKVGIGFGVKYIINNNKVRRSSIPWTFPILADVRGNIISQQDRGAIPYWSLDVGGELRGGFLFSPTIGYRFGQDRKSLTIGICYQLTHTYTKNDNELLNGLLAKIGYEF